MKDMLNIEDMKEKECTDDSEDIKGFAGNFERGKKEDNYGQNDVKGTEHMWIYYNTKDTNDLEETEDMEDTGKLGIRDMSAPLSQPPSLSFSRFFSLPYPRLVL